MKQLQVTDQQLAKIIKQNDLKLRSSEGCTLAANYYNNSDLSVELLVLLNNSTGEKAVYIVKGRSIYDLDIHIK